MKKKKYILVTDLDDTLVGDETTTKELFQYLYRDYADLQLIYVTGRHIRSAEDLIEKAGLPLPHILICDVGSSIYFPLNNKFIEDKTWKGIIAEDWFPEEILTLARKQELQVQEGIPLSKRVSLHVTDKQAVKQFCQRLIHQELTHKVIYSSGKDLDILPANSGKGNAVEYVLENFYNENHSVLIAGNSGNDLEMLCLGYPSVIVGNAEKELRMLEKTPMIYQAKEQYAKGIKEAWESFYQK